MANRRRSSGTKQQGAAFRSGFTSEFQQKSLSTFSSSTLQRSRKMKPEKQEPKMRNAI